MERKKRLIIVLLIVIIAVAALIICISMFSGSLKKDSYKDLVESSYKVSDEKRQYAEQSPAAFANLLITDTVSYEIVKAGKNDITLDITAPDMKDIMDGIVSESTVVTDSAEETSRIQAYVINRLKSKDYKTVTNTVTVKIENDKDGNSCIIPTEEYLDAIYGGLYSYYNAIQTQAKGE